jgi:hypothetical protein
MEPLEERYPERLFSQPDFDLLFKYFPETVWPKMPDFLNDLDNSKDLGPKVGGRFEERIAFWEALKDPFNTSLVEQRHDVDYFVKLWKLEGYAEKEEGALNGILVWDPKPKKVAREKIRDMEREYLTEGKDFSAELFAIHFGLKLLVEREVNPIRRKPFFTKEQLEHWETGQSSPELKTQLENRADKNLSELIQEYETELRFKHSKTKAELKSVREKLAIAKNHLLNIKSSLKFENLIRQTVCRWVIDFLVTENVCKSPTGTQMIGAFLIFSSGLSFRNLKRMPNLEFEQEFAKKFRESLKPTKSKG